MFTSEMELTRIDRQHQFEPMVLSRRYLLHYRFIRHGRTHDTGSWLSLLRVGTAKVGAHHDMGLHGQRVRHHIPMVLLGIFACFLSSGDQRLHW